MVFVFSVSGADSLQHRFGWGYTQLPTRLHSMGAASDHRLPLCFPSGHCFLSIYEMVVDVLFLCFAVDTKYNDGRQAENFIWIKY